MCSSTPVALITQVRRWSVIAAAVPSGATLEVGAIVAICDRTPRDLNEECPWEGSVVDRGRYRVDRRWMRGHRHSLPSALYSLSWCLRPQKSSPRPAATVLALRRSGSPFEVLMVRRAREASFMGGARVFPGGAVDAADSGPLAASVVRWSGDNEERPWRAAAMRELAEEVGIFIGAPQLTWRGAPEGTSIAPWRMPRSSLTARVCCTSATGSPPAAPQAVRHPLLHRRSTSDTVARSDRVEVFDPIWVTPPMRSPADDGTWQVEVPTRANLEVLARASDLDDALRTARNTTPVRTEPRLVMDAAGAWSVLLPGDPGFEEPES